MTDDEKIDVMVTYLTESHLDFFGGYPYDYSWFGDTLVVASLDDGKDRARTQIDEYDKAALIRWADRAIELSRNDPDYWGTETDADFAIVLGEVTADD